MAHRYRRELGLVIGWLVFPLVPVILENFYYQACNINLFSPSPNGPDPREWDWGLWIIMLGPLLGYGFLAGATVDIPDDLGPSCRGLRRLLHDGRCGWRSDLGAASSSGAVCISGHRTGEPGSGQVGTLNPNPNQNVPSPGSQGTWVGAVWTWAGTVVGWIILGAGSGRDSGLWLAVADAGRPSASGADRPVEVGLWTAVCSPRTDLDRLALRQFLGGTSPSWRSYLLSPRIVPLVRRCCRSAWWCSAGWAPRSVVVRVPASRGCSTRCRWPG